MGTNMYPYPSVEALSSGLVLGLDMRQTGAVVKDNSIYHNDMTIGGSPTFSTVSTGPIASFVAASTQRLSVTDKAILSPTGNSGLTVAMIMRRLNSTNGGYFAKYSLGAAEYIAGVLSNLLYFWVIDQTLGGYVGRNMPVGLLPLDGAYHLLVFKWTGGTVAASDIGIWVDNVKRDTTNFAAGSFTSVRDTASSFYIGFNEYGLGTNVYSTVNIGCFRMWNRSLSTAEMTALYVPFATAKTQGKVVSNLILTGV